MKMSKRRADQRLKGFEALTAFANMGNNPEDWRKFRQMWPNFFPTSASQFEKPGFRTLTEWIYTFAEEWAHWEPELRGHCVNPLLWYRDRIRAVWARNDPDGSNLKILYGFEKQVAKVATLHADFDQTFIVSPFLIPHQPTNPDERSTIVGLPGGRAVVNPTTGDIDWEFGCELQQSVYELMHQRWRTKICPACGRYFLADKPAQSTCSIDCSASMRKRSKLDYWNTTGSKNRAKKNKEGKNQ